MTLKSLEKDLLKKKAALSIFPKKKIQYLWSLDTYSTIDKYSSGHFTYGLKLREIFVKEAIFWRGCLKWFILLSVHLFELFIPLFLEFQKWNYSKILREISFKPISLPRTELKINMTSSSVGLFKLTPFFSRQIWFSTILLILFGLLFGTWDSKEPS